MTIYLVAYDVVDQATDRTAVTAALEENYDDRCHMQSSVWLVETEKRSSEIKADLAACLGRQDRLFVMRLMTRVSARNLDEKGIDWLKAKKVQVF
ncbi:MAG: hypothetical protein ACHQK9_01030 [Reyranellales bacterium]